MLDDLHGAKLEALEGLAALPDPLLSEDRRTAILQLDQQHDRDEQGTKEDEEQNRGDNINGPPSETVERIGRRATRLEPTHQCRRRI